MKKFAGTFILTAVLLLHVVVIISTEDSYIFSTSDQDMQSPEYSASATFVSGPVRSGTALHATGFYFSDQELNP